MLIEFHKPFGVLSQFNPSQECPEHPTLASFSFPKDVYPIGRLDRDSEGLLLLTDEKPLVGRLLHPSHAHPREYHAQVEGTPSPGALARLAAGKIPIQGYLTLPCQAWLLDPPPAYPDRDPPIRYRAEIPATWIALELIEGKNRQVRRMTAAVGHPTLRLIRARIGQHSLNLPPGEWRELPIKARRRVLASS